MCSCRNTCTQVDNSLTLSRGYSPLCMLHWFSLGFQLDTAVSCMTKRFASKTLVSCNSVCAYRLHEEVHWPSFQWQGWVEWGLSILVLLCQSFIFVSEWSGIVCRGNMHDTCVHAKCMWKKYGKHQHTWAHHCACELCPFLFHSELTQLATCLASPVPGRSKCTIKYVNMCRYTYVHACTS